MKKIIIFIIALLIIAAISPKFIGKIVETEHQTVLSELNEQVITVKKMHFTRHWFGGSASTDIIVHLNNPQVDDFSITINEELFFGPIIWADNGLHFGLSYSELTFVLEDDEKANNFLKNNLHLSWLLSFNRNITTDIKVDEYLTELDYKKIAIKPAAGQFTMTTNKRVYGDFTWQGAEIITDNKITINSLSVLVDQQLIRGSYAKGDAVTTGDFSLAIDEVKVTEINNDSIAYLKAISMSATAKEINNMLQLGLNYHIGLLELEGKSFQQANMAIKFDHLDIETMQAFSKLAATLDEHSDQHQIVMDKLMVLGSQLIAKEPVLIIEDISVLTPQGKIVMTAKAQFDQTKFDQQNMMMTAMNALEVNAQATAPVAFFAEGDKKNVIDMYLQQGLIIKEGDLLKTQLSFKEGKLMVNDTEIPM